MRIGIFVAGALATGLMIVPGAEAQKWTGSSSEKDLRYRLDVLDAELADIRARLGGLKVRPKRPTGAGGGSAAVEAELRRLTAAVERLEINQRKLAKEVGKRLGDIEFRLNELEGNPTAKTKPRPLLGGGTGGTGRKEGPLVSVTERNDLARATKDVKQGRFDQAETRLTRFMRDYPRSPLLGEAWYWRGESQYVRGIYDKAAESYLKGYQANPRGPHAPHNLYKLGATLGQLKQQAEACLTLREVPARFPRAPGGLADKARSMAATLGCT